MPSAAPSTAVLPSVGCVVTPRDTACQDSRSLRRRREVQSSQRPLGLAHGLRESSRDRAVPPGQHRVHGRGVRRGRGLRVQATTPCATTRTPIHPSAATCVTSQPAAAPTPGANPARARARSTTAATASTTTATARSTRQDEHCIGACSNNESGFNGNIAGQNNAPCKMDCYFDRRHGRRQRRLLLEPHAATRTSRSWRRAAPTIPTQVPGQQELRRLPDHAVRPVRWEHELHAVATGATADRWFRTAATASAAACSRSCLPRQNVNGTMMKVGVYLGSSSRRKPRQLHLDVILAGNPTRSSVTSACRSRPASTPATTASSASASRLPPDCTEQSCPTGVQKCGLPGQQPCPDGQYCVTGCCAVNPN